MTDLVVGKDENSSWSYAHSVSESVQEMHLAANTEITVAVPAGIHVMLMQVSVGTNVAMGINLAGAITMPTVGVSRTAADTQLGDGVFNVVAADTIHVISDTAALVYLSFYRR